MSALAGELIARVRETGPLSIADYMVECLSHPKHGYYATRDPFGAQGDFITAPEISQMFGELIGLCLAQTWIDHGAPARFNLVELGPGRGTCMADILRATKGVPGFHDALTVYLVETSPVLRARQVETIKHPVTHCDSFGDVPDGPIYLVANEFFDALPVRQFVRSGEAWRERVVGVEDGALAFGLADESAPFFMAPRLEDTREGDLVEVSIASSSIAAEIGARLEAQGGAALIIDYGDWRALGDTFQAVSAHEKVDPLADPGLCDLTCHVDFEALATAASKAKATRLTTQGVFLERLGITDRARALAENLGGAALESHISAHRRLTHGAEMGTLFKVMALYNSSQTPPPGLEP